MYLLLEKDLNLLHRNNNKHLRNEVLFSYKELGGALWELRVCLVLVRREISP